MKTVVSQNSVKLKSMLHYYVCLLLMTLPKQTREKICQFAGYEARLHVFASRKCCVFVPLFAQHTVCQHGTLPKSAALMCPSGVKT